MNLIIDKKEALSNPKDYRFWSGTLWKDREVVLATVRQLGLALQYAAKELRADREVVFAAIQQNGNALLSASDELRADREVVLAAVQRNGDALLYASKALRADREVVLAAVQQNGYALEYASNDLRADREFVLTAVRENGDALFAASKDLCADREVVLAAVQQNGKSLGYASSDLRTDHEIVLAAVQRDARALHSANETLRQNERFMAELSDVCPLGTVWRYKPQVTSAETARKAMHSKDGLLLLVKQARVSLLGEPAMMKELLLSALEQGCLKETVQALIAGQKKGILDALRTVMAWYGVELPDALTTDVDDLSELISSTIVGTGSGIE